MAVNGKLPKSYKLVPLLYNPPHSHMSIGVQFYLWFK